MLLSNVDVEDRLFSGLVGQVKHFKIVNGEVKVTEADLGLVKLVVITNVSFNYHQHEIEIKLLIWVK